MSSQLWQHRIPKHPEECDADPVAPDTSQPYDIDLKEYCFSCGAEIVEVDKNEGPEALKALLRF